MKDWSAIMGGLMILTWIVSWFAAIWLWLLVSPEIGFASFATGGFALFLAVLLAVSSGDDEADQEEADQEEAE